ncbi:putative ribonuclease H-like domain-containing protein [Tanacetum coccineum]
MSIPITAEEKTNKKNDVNARSLILMALPNEHQLTFSQYPDAKNMFATIETRFGVIAQEDLNSKNLSSFPPEWNTHVVVWMNKPEVETISIDDLYNNFKIVEQKVKKSVGASSGDQNLAFMTAPSTSSTNDANTASPQVNTSSPNVNTASPQVSTASFSDNAVYAFMNENTNGSNLLHQDLEQINEDDLEAMDLKWQLSLQSMRVKRYYQRIGKKIFINANDTAGYDKSKLECFNCHKMGYFSRECRAPRSKEGQFRNQDNTRKQENNKDTSSKAMLAIDGVDSEVYTDKTCSKTCLKNYETLKKQCDDLIVKLNQTEFTATTYKRGLAILEEQLITYRKNEVLFSEEVAILKREVACKDYEVNMLKNQLLGSQITDKTKKGLGYSAVPLPHPLIYNRPKKLDLSYSGLDEFKEPEFKGYGPENSKQESNIVCDKKLDESKENSDNSLVKEQVSKDTSSFVESSLNIDKETVFPVDKKVESIKPKGHEKPVKKSIRLSAKTIRGKGWTVNTARPQAVNTARPKTVKTTRLNFTVVNTVREKGGKPQQDDTRFVDSGCSRHMTGNIAYLSDFKEFNGGYVTFGGGAHGALFEGRLLIYTVKAWMERYVISKVGNEAVHKELSDRIERDATTASSLEAEYDSALIDKKKLVITETSIRSDLHLEDTRGTDCLPTATIFEELTKMGYEKPSQKLTFYKAFFSPQWKFLLHTITQSLSAKSTAWNEFSSTMASLIICLATNQKFNLSKYIFDDMLGDMSHHKKIYVNPSHTKKFFANIKRAGNNFSRRITPLFDTMMVQASDEVGKDSDHLTDSNQIPIVDQPSTSSQPKQKQKSKRKQGKEAKVTHDETEHEESILTPSNDPLPSDEDSMQLNDLMVLCTKLQKQVLDLEKAKSDQAIKIASLKKRVDKLEKRRKFRTTGLKRLKKVGMSRRVESSEDQESLGDHEDASKQGRRIEDIEADAEVTLVNETQERQDEDLMFDTGVLNGDEMFVDAITGEKDEQSTKINDSTSGEAVTTTGVEDSAAPTIPTTVEETLAQTLMEIKAAKHKAKGIVFHDLEKQPERPLTKKDQVALNEDLARNIQDQLDAEIIEEERLLAERLQTREREELTDEEKGKLFMELMEKRRKHFAALRAQEKRNRPPTKAQKRSQMSTYLKHMGGYKHKQLMGKSYDEIQKLFDKEMKRVNTFVAMSSEAQESNEKKVEGSEEKAKSSRKKSLGKKRAVKEQQQESSKKQRMEDDKETDEVEEVKEVEEDYTAELKKHLVIKKDDDIAIDAIPLATKPPVIVEYKLVKDGIMLVKTNHGDTRPEDEHERVLLGDFKVMFELDIRSKVWRDLQGYTVSVRKLYDSCGVHFVRFGNVHIFMLVEKRYPLTPITITNMLNKKLQSDHFNEMCYQLLKLMIQKMNIKFRGGLLGLKRLQGFLLLRSTAGTYYCLCSVYAAGYKDTTARRLTAVKRIKTI